MDANGRFQFGGCEMEAEAEAVEASLNLTLLIHYPCPCFFFISHVALFSFSDMRCGTCKSLIDAHNGALFISTKTVTQQVL